MVLEEMTRTINYFFWPLWNFKIKKKKKPLANKAIRDDEEEEAKGTWKLRN